MLRNLDRWIAFNIFLAISATIRDRARYEIDIVTHDAGTPARRQELWERALARLIGSQRNDKIGRAHV